MNYIYANKYKSTKKVFSEIQARSVGELPIRIQDRPEIIRLVDRALKAREDDFTADISDIMLQIDRIVYDIYELSDEEISVIESGNV